MCLLGGRQLGAWFLRTARTPPTLPPQDKTHPRSDFSQRGRVRVELKDPITGDPTVEDIVNRKQLLQKLADMIPKLKSRKENPKPLQDPGLPPGYPGLPGGTGESAGFQHLAPVLPWPRPVAARCATLARPRAPQSASSAARGRPVAPRARLGCRATRRFQALGFDQQG